VPAEGMTGCLCARRIVKRIRMPFRATGREMRIVLIATDDKAWCRHGRKINVEEWKPCSVLLGHVVSAASRRSQQDARRDARIGEILAVQLLLMLHGVGHGLGGIAGLDAKETETEAPDVLEATKRLTLAWLQNALDVDPPAWAKASAAIADAASALGHVVRRKAE
jgi:hypothetical protein